MKKIKQNKHFLEIYGYHAVQAALQNKLRKHKKLIISSKAYQLLSENLKKKADIIIKHPDSKFTKIYGNKNIHQGIILQTLGFVQPTLDDIIINSKVKKSDLVVMLDHVTDPNNIGSIMRSCALFNCHSIIVSKDNAPDISSSMMKAASGAAEVVNYIKVTNLSRAIDKFKKNNFWVFGFDSKIDKKSDDIKLSKKSLLVFGSEGKGLRKSTKKHCDQIIKIPTYNHYELKLDSLNVSNACSIALYEHFKLNK